MTTATLPAPDSATTPEKKGRGRAIAAVLVFALACLLTAPALLGHWAHRTITDTARFLDTVEPLAEDPKVQEAVSILVTEAIVEKIDTQQVVGDLLGSLLGGLGQSLGGDGSRGEAAADALSGPIAAGINSAIGSAVAGFLASEEFDALWKRFMEATHVSLIALLEGKDTGVIQTDGDAIVLDVQTVIDGTKQAIVDRGITIVENIEITPTQQQIVLAEVPGLTQVQAVYRASNPLFAWFPLILTALFGAAVLLARNRSRMVIATGIALLVNTFIALWALRRGEAGFINAFGGTPLEAASLVFWETLLRYLIDGMQALFLLGAAITLGGWLGGRSRPAAALRAPIERGLTQLGSVTRLPAAQAVAAHVTRARILATAVVVILFAIGDVMSLWAVIWSVLLLALLFVAIEVWRASAAAPARTP